MLIECHMPQAALGIMYSADSALGRKMIYGIFSVERYMDIASVHVKKTSGSRRFLLLCIVMKTLLPKQLQL